VGHFKYFLAPKLSAPDFFYLPCWRFKGIVFPTFSPEHEGKIVDSNRLALKLAGVPVSLGVRPQALKLRYAVQGVEGVFLAPQLSFRALAVAGHGGLSEHTVQEIFIGETESLIYSPFSVHGDLLFDAIIERPVCQLHEPLDVLPAEPACREDGISFVATLCPACGWDLEGEKETLVLLCPKCVSGRQAKGAVLERVQFGFTRDHGRQTPAVYLPFWRISAAVTGLELKS
jgi:hypothetical protein